MAENQETTPTGISVVEQVQPVRESVTFDDIEAQQAAEAAEPTTKEKVDALPDILGTKLEGESVGERWKGKSVAELIAEADRSDAGLRALLEARSTQQPTQQQPIYQAPNAPPFALLTEEQFNELHQQSPARAAAYTQAYSEWRLGQLYDQRTAGLVDAQIKSAEEQARVRHKDDFVILGKEIEAAISEVRASNPGVLANPLVLDKLVASVRGEHIEKVIAHRASTQRTAEQTRARDVVQQPNLSNGRRQTVSSSEGDLTDEESKVMKAMGFTSKQEWNKWRSR